MALKSNSSETDESSDCEDSKMKSYITRQFKKFMKNANGKGFDKDSWQSSSSQFKIQDKGKKDARDGSQYTVPAGPKCFGCQGFGHMKQECPTYLKSIGKSKALAATLSDTKPEDGSDNEDDRILNAFTTIVNPTDVIVKDVVEEEELVESKFEKMDDQDDIHIAYEKLYNFLRNMRNFIGWPPRSSVIWNLIVKSFDEANQTIGALRWEKFLGWEDQEAWTGVVSS